MESDLKREYSNGEDRVFESRCPKCKCIYLTLEALLKCDECYGECGVVEQHNMDKVSDKVILMLVEAPKSGHKLVVVFRDGKKTIIKKRKKKRFEGTPAQKQAALKAGRHAHTAEAKIKRRKSVLARKEAGLIRNI